MKRFSKVFALLFLSVFFISASAIAVPISGTALQDVINANGWNFNAQNDQMTMPDGWTLTNGSSMSSMTFYKEQPDGMSFGIYSTANPAQEAIVFDGSDTPETRATVYFHGGDAVVVEVFDNDNPITPETNMYAFSGEIFGFWISYGSTKYYSDENLNDVNGNSITGEEEDIALLAYRADDGSYIFAGDLDKSREFANIVTHAESIKPVPEPATMILFGLGLLGVAGVGRKKLYS
mgnify:CR=1 FL=1